MVEDAQYVYREMPSTVKPAGWWGDPYFINMLEEDEYCGSSYITTPYNAYCYFHCDYRHWGGNPPAEDSGYTPPPEDDTTDDTTDDTDIDTDDLPPDDDPSEDDIYEPDDTDDNTDDDVDETLNLFDDEDEDDRNFWDDWFGRD